MPSKHIGGVVVVAFAVVVICFVSSTWIAEHQSAEVERAALGVRQHAGPAMRGLAAAQAELHQLQLAVHGATEDGAGPEAVMDVRARRLGLAQQLAAYAALPLYPGEVDAWQRAERAHDRLEEALAEMVAAFERGDHASARQLTGRFDAASDALARALAEDLEVNVAVAQSFAAEIRMSRRRGLIWAFVLAGLGVLVAAAGAGWSLRAARA